MAEQVILGSGDLYIMEYEGGVLPTDTTIETAENLIGRIKGGASIEYKPTEYEVVDDSFNIQKRFVISEEVVFKSGILTWNVETLSKIMAAGSYTDDSTEHIRTLTLGGIGARLMKEYVIHFVHTEADGNKFTVTLVGTASNGFSIAFAPDKETVIDAEFKAKAQGNTGTQLILTESYTAG